MKTIKRYIQTVETDPLFDIASLAVETEITDLAVEHDHYLLTFRISWTTKKPQSTQRTQRNINSVISVSSVVDYPPPIYFHSIPQIFQK